MANEETIRTIEHARRWFADGDRQVLVVNGHGEHRRCNTLAEVEKHLLPSDTELDYEVPEEEAPEPTEPEEPLKGDGAPAEAPGTDEEESTEDKGDVEDENDDIDEEEED